MNVAESSRLDADEYLHLALHASAQGDHEKAIACLKSAIAIVGDAEDAALAWHLLAAEHAQIGLYRRAREEFRRALELRPDLEAARFQLALLQLQLDEPSSARESFGQLAGRSTDPALDRFARGLMAIIDNAHADGLSLIDEGLSCCANVPLREDMARLAKNIAAARTTNNAALFVNGTSGEPVNNSTSNGAASELPGDRANEERPRTSPIFLGAYRRRDDTT